MTDLRRHRPVGFLLDFFRHGEQGLRYGSRRTERVLADLLEGDACDRAKNIGVCLPHRRGRDRRLEIRECGEVAQQRVEIVLAKRIAKIDNDSALSFPHLDVDFLLRNWNMGLFSTHWALPC